ncbi:MAG: hypothetical protein PHQ42_03920 [Patescibacteria group bacterium]|nr:hypothetical protein [Patescibacteria group bacterium]
MILKAITNKQRIIIGFIRISLVLAILGSIYEINWMSLFVSSLVLVLSFSPEFFFRRYNIFLPNSLQIFAIVFIYAGLFLGEVRSFYIKFWWWDSLLHLLSGLALGFAGFLLVYIFNKTGKFRSSHILLAVFSFCFALALGALWEIFEFFLDHFFHLDMQNARDLCDITMDYCDSRLGVIDTMYDLVLDSAGALGASVIGFLYLKKKTPSFIKEIIRDFEKKNKSLFMIGKRIK